ncbi:MAG TPA: anthranilate phosphoribosyltransferase [Candidatus Acidoferrum sp.]|nr:anthranilate phosphoribosyltransferase [Candidatus Acidoferrum sp.]
MLRHALEIIAAGRDLSRAEAEAAMEEVLGGRATHDEIVSLLAGLSTKGETVDELVAFASAIRRHAPSIFPTLDDAGVEEGLLDTCGTGGDASGTFNISTAVAFVVAGAGVRVAKHGNRSISSRCGSADVLEELGVEIDLPPESIRRSIETVGIGFLFAPAMHTATRHAAAARREFGKRTVFNLLGPLTNPARASAQVVGVYDRAVVEPMARALGELGVRRAFVVHGADGLDEISLSGETYVSELREGRVASYRVSPEDFGLNRAPLEAICGGDAKRNAAIVHRVLGRSLGVDPYRAIVLVNAAAALVAAGKAQDFHQGVELAAKSIDSRAARERLDRLIAFSRSERGRH